MPRRSILAGCAAALAAAVLLAAPAFAGPRSCAEEQSLRSSAHDAPVTLAFRNELTTPADLYWLDYAGKRHAFGAVPAGGSVTEHTYATHPWVLADASGHCLAVIVADPETSEFRLDSDTHTEATYTTLDIEGWQVKVNADLKRFDAALADRELTLLSQELANIRRVVPARHVAELQKVPFWLEYDDGPSANLFYHSSYEGARSVGKPASKVHAIEITSARAFVASVSWEPWVVLHELSHAYHQQVLGFDDPTIRSAYRNAVAHHLYEKVRHYDGKLMRAYALTNEREYFAELTEAYFGRNDFYPFTRADLAAYDPVGYAMVRHLWEER